MKYLSLTVAASALLLAPATAHAQLFGGLDNSSLLGGITGAGIGGAIGSNLAGSGNRDEGTAIGAVLGGLAGTAYGNSRSNYYGNPYAGSFNPGFSGNSLVGTAIGAGLGGAIGSNLAGSGVRQEGTAIGAVLGGLAGNALTRGNSRYGNSGFGGGYGGGFGPVGGNSRYGANAPVIGGGFGPTGFGPGFVPAGYGPGFGAPVMPAPIPAPMMPAPFVPAPQFGATLPPMPMGGTSFIPGGFVEAGTFANTVTVPAPRPAPLPILPAPSPVYQPLSNAFTGVTIAAPNVRLAGPALVTSTRYGSSLGSTTTQDYVPSTGVRVVRKLKLRPAPKPRSQVVVIERDHYSPAASTASYNSHNHDHSYSAPAPVAAPSYSAPSGPSIHADTVNINYGNNSQVGTHGSNNGSTVTSGAAHSHAAAPIDFGDGIGDGTWGNMSGSMGTPAPLPLAPTVQTSSYSAGSTSVLGGYSAPQTVQHGQAGGSYLVTSGQSFQAPSAAEYAADCASTTFGCAGPSSLNSSSMTSTAPAYVAPVYTPNYESHSSHSHDSHSQGVPTQGYSFCDSDEVYDDNGALILGASPVCR